MVDPIHPGMKMSHSSHLLSVLKLDETSVPIIVILTLIKLVALVLALVLTHLTYMSARNTQQADLKILTVGFGSIAVGIILGGGIYWLANFDALATLMVESVFLTIGLGMITFSLYGYE